MESIRSNQSVMKVRAPRSTTPLDKAKPTARDPAGTRLRLLDAATLAFAAHGFAGAATDQIVTEARINKRMLYHHFGDKEGLFREVLRREWQALGSHLVGAMATAGAGQRSESGSESALVTATLALCDFLGKRPAFIRLVMWEGLAGGAISRSLWTDVRGPLAGVATGLFADAKRQGHIDPALDDKQLLVTLLGAVAFYFAYAPALTDLFGGDPLTPQRLARRKRHVADVLRMLAGDAAEGLAHARKR